MAFISEKRKRTVGEAMSWPSDDTSIVLNAGSDVVNMSNSVDYVISYSRVCSVRPDPDNLIAEET